MSACAAAGRVAAAEELGCGHDFGAGGVESGQAAEWLERRAMRRGRNWRALHSLTRPPRADGLLVAPRDITHAE